jgi:hypothetical protein
MMVMLKERTFEDRIEFIAKGAIGKGKSWRD